MFTYWVQDEAAVGVQPDLALVRVGFDTLVEEVGVSIRGAAVGGSVRVSWMLWCAVGRRRRGVHVQEPGPVSRSEGGQTDSYGAVP